MMTATNYDDVLAQIQDFGGELDALPIGQGLFRFRTVDDRRGQKSGFCVLFEWRTESGDVLVVGIFGDWRQGGDAHKVAISRKLKLTPDERAGIRRRIAEDRKRAAATRQRKAEKAAAKASNMWRNQCTPMGSDDIHGYLVRKFIRAYNIRKSMKGALVIPLTDAAGNIVGLQLILDPEVHAEAIKRLGRDKVFHPPGMSKKGNFHLIGSIRSGCVVLIAEGYATAATLHEATGLPVAVAFDCGNLQPVAEALIKHYKRLRILFCADDDYLGRCSHCRKQVVVSVNACPHCAKEHGRVNTGIVKASTAAVVVSGDWLAPVFTDRNGERLTDWNDLMQAEGLHQVRSQIEAKLNSLQWAESAASEHAHKGGRAKAPASIFRLDQLLERFSLIQFNESTAFDHDTGEVVRLQDMRDLCSDKCLLRDWQAHTERKVVAKENVGFDPTELDETIICNLFGGMPTQPKAGHCDALLDVLRYLCSSEKHGRDIFNWVMCWLAFPLQNPGAKMQTSLLFHGMEGGGKNIFFDVFLWIYKEYSVSFNQSDLEDRFNDIFSAKLFAIGNEVVSRAEIYHLQGKIKNMITEPSWTINPKNRPRRQESNHCNFVFFSNRPDIAKLDADDRRFCVVWTPGPSHPDLYAEAADELNNGGKAALYDHLMKLDLGGFNEHTKPPETDAKNELIALTKDSPERFFDAWRDGELDCKLKPCRSGDLFTLYRRWCTAEGERWPVPHNKFSSILRKACPVEFERPKINGKTTRVIIPADHITSEGGEIGEMKPTENKAEWITRSVNEFHYDMEGSSAKN